MAQNNTTQQTEPITAQPGNGRGVHLKNAVASDPLHDPEHIWSELVASCSAAAGNPHLPAALGATSHTPRPTCPRGAQS